MQPSLHRRLLQMTLTPVLVFALALSAYFAVTQHLRAERLFEQHAQNLARVMSPAVAASLRSEDIGALEALAMEALNVPDSRAFRVYANDTVIFERGRRDEFTDGPNTLSVPAMQREHSLVRVTYPLTTDIGDTPTAWLVLDFSDTDLKLSNYRQITLGALIALLSLGLIWLLILRLGRAITVPFYNVMDTVRALAEGHLDRRSQVDENSDIKTLSQGVNALGESLQHAQSEMQHSVDQATQDLRETLETLEIQNIQLSTARRQALEANEAKTQFLANMSHEIRTPLNGVIGFVKLLDRTDLNQKQRDYVSTLRQSSEGLLNIINDILDFLKLDAGKLVVENRSMNIRDIVEDVLEIMAPMAHEKALELVALVYDDVPLHLLGDPLRLRQVLTNLVNNAVKFTEKGHVAVRVSYEGEHNGRQRLRLSVSDTGPGIPRSKQKILFKAFNQADASTSRRYGGTGLGLVICQRLVHRMGGKIQLESVEGEGTTFFAVLDFDPDPKPTADNDDNLLLGAHAWLYDPNELTQLTVQHRLERWGLSVQTITPDNNELPTAEADHAHAMAVLTYDRGQESWLKSSIQQFQAAGIPSLLLTRHNDHSEALKKLEQQVSAFTTKPVRYQRLYSLCSDLLNMGQPLADSDEDRLPHILVVDDNEINRRLLVTFLDDFGVQADEAEDGSQAMARISQHHYDLVFMDIQMPVMDGVTATREIRRHEAEDQHLPVIALTAHALPQEREALMASGLDDYLTKPISEQQLAETVRHWTGVDLERHRDAHRLSSIPAPRADSNDSDETTHSEPVDLHQGLQRAGGKPDLARDMFAGLLDQLRNTQWQMEDWYQREDWDSLLDATHALHGVTRYCGTPDLEHSLLALETHLKQLPEMQAKVPAAFEDLKQEISRLLHWSDQTDWQHELKDVGPQT